MPRMLGQVVNSHPNTELEIPVDGCLHALSLITREVGKMLMFTVSYAPSIDTLAYTG